MKTCVFCDFEQIRNNTIATVRGFYVTATLGQITNGGYLLVLPMKHTKCVGAMSLSDFESCRTLVSEMAEILSVEYETDVVIFEHGVVGQTVPHAHLHLIPSKFNLTMEIVKDFPSAEIQRVDAFDELRSLYQQRKEPYLFWSEGDERFNICWNPPAEPMYLRFVTARLLGVPERGNWRQMDPALDKMFREETVERIYPYLIP